MSNQFPVSSYQAMIALQNVSGSGEDQINSSMPYHGAIWLSGSTLKVGAGHGNGGSDTTISASAYLGDGSGLSGVQQDIDSLSALGSAAMAQGDHLMFSDAGTEKKVTFSNFEDSIFGNVSGDATIAAGGALTIAADAVEGSMLNDNIISGQGALGGASVAQADLLMIDDGPGTVKKVTFSNFEDSIFGNVSSDATVAAGGALTIANDAVTTAKILNANVTTAKIADDAVDSDKIAATISGMTSLTSTTLSCTHLTASYIKVIENIDTVSVTESSLEIIDKTIVAASGASAALANGGGLMVGGSAASPVASMVLSNTGASWSHSIGTQEVLTVSSGSTKATGKVYIDTSSAIQDPSIQFQLAGTTNFVVGIDNSDSDKFKIHSATSLADSSDFMLTAAGECTIADLVATTADINGGTIDGVTLGSTNVIDVTAVNIDGGTDIGEALVDADLFLVDNGATGTNVKSAMSRVKTYVGAAAGAFDIGYLDVDGGTDIGGALDDADLLIVDDGAGGANRKTAMSRVMTYIESGLDTLANDLTLGDNNLTDVDNLEVDKIQSNASASLNINFDGTTGNNLISLKDNLASALNIAQGSNSYMMFVTTDNSEYIAVGKELAAAGGISLTSANACSQLAFGNDSSSPNSKIRQEGPYGRSALTISGSANATSLAVSGSGVKWMNGTNERISFGLGTTTDYAIDVGGGSSGTNNINKIRASAFVTFSKRDLKEDIKPLNNALDDVMKMQGVSYSLKGADKRAGVPDTKQEVGFIAEEMYNVVPQVVSTGGDGSAHGIDYAKLTAVLTEAIKEQQKQIEDLKSKVNKLT